MNTGDGAPRGWMIVPPSRETLDGIRDFAARLSSALASDFSMQTFTTADDAAPDAGTAALPRWSALPSGVPPAAIFVNYAPQAWLRADTRALVARLRAARAGGARVILIVHEYQLDPGASVARRLGRLVFARLARAFAAASSAVVTTHGFVADWARRDGLERYARIVTIPAGSNLPEPRVAEPRQHRVVMFGQPAGMAPAMMRAGAEAAAQAGFDLRWLCRREEESRAWMRVHGIAAERVTLVPGRDGASIARELATAAIGFAPIIDGVSTRRTTVAALAQYSLPIAGSDGRATDRVFRDSEGFALASVDDPAAIAPHLRRLMANDTGRARIGDAARKFYEDRLAWPRLAAQYLALVR